MEGTCTKLSCDYWRPPEWVRHKTPQGCKFGETCAFLHSKNSDPPNKTSNKDSKSGQALVASVRSTQKLCCVSQDVKLSIYMVGLTNARRSPLKKAARDLQGYISNLNTRRLQNIHERNMGKKQSREELNIIAAPTRLLLRTEVQITCCGQQMVQEKLHSSHQSYSG